MATSWDDTKRLPVDPRLILGIPRLDAMSKQFIARLEGKPEKQFFGGNALLHFDSTRDLLANQPFSH